MSRKLNAVRINLQYRDSANYKTDIQAVLSNKYDLHTDLLTHYLMRTIGDGELFMAQYYGLPSAAPYSNEHLPAPDNDHPYMQIIDWEWDHVFPDYEFEFGDVSDFIYLLIIDGDPEIKQQHLEEAEKTLSEHLREVQIKLSGATTVAIDK